MLSQNIIVLHSLFSGNFNLSSFVRVHGGAAPEIHQHKITHYITIKMWSDPLFQHLYHIKLPLDQMVIRPNGH